MTRRPIVHIAATSSAISIAAISPRYSTGASDPDAVTGRTGRMYEWGYRKWGWPGSAGWPDALKPLRSGPMTEDTEATRTCPRHTGAANRHGWQLQVTDDHCACAARR